MDGGGLAYSAFHINLIVFILLHLFYFVYMLFKQQRMKTMALDRTSLVKPKNMRKINEVCAICLECVNNEVQMACSHSFCAKCILEYRQHSSILCPMCRRESRLMFSMFERTERTKDYYDRILAYNHDESSMVQSSFFLLYDVYSYAVEYIRKIDLMAFPCQ